MITATIKEFNIEFNSNINNKAINIIENSNEFKLEKTIQFIKDCIKANICPKCGNQLKEWYKEENNDGDTDLFKGVECSHNKKHFSICTWADYESDHY